MESTGVAASIPETESVDASSFVQASREVPTGSVWALKSCGETFLCFLDVVLFVWVSLSALVALVLGAVVRFCRPFSRCWVLSGVLFRARFPLCFVRQGDDPRTDLLAGDPPLWRQWHRFTALRIRWVRVLGVDAGATRRTTPVTSCGRGHPPNSREWSELP